MVATPDLELTLTKARQIFHTVVFFVAIFDCYFVLLLFLQLRKFSKFAQQVVLVLHIFEFGNQLKRRPAVT